MVRREFIKLICRERFSTDLVRHLINPTNDAGDDDDDEHLIVIVRKIVFHFHSRTKINNQSLLIC